MPETVRYCLNRRNPFLGRTACVDTTTKQPQGRTLTYVIVASCCQHKLLSHFYAFHSVILKLPRVLSKALLKFLLDIFVGTASLGRFIPLLSDRRSAHSPEQLRSLSGGSKTEVRPTRANWSHRKRLPFDIRTTLERQMT